MVFWTGWGRDLHYNVYSNDVHWYSEELGERGKVIATVALSAVFGACVAAAAWGMRKVFARKDRA